MPEVSVLLPAGVFLTALLSASVGHGGASGYLAVLSLSAMPVHQMAASALILNLLVSGIALSHFARAGYFSWRITWPFALGSVPAAWLGGWLRVPPQAYEWLLGSVLLVAAWRLWVEMPRPQVAGRLRPVVALPAGAGIGVLSGMVGIGGGIFLSPLLIFKGWADAKGAAAISAFFVLANSAAGIAGRMAGGQFHPGLAGPLAGAAFCGGLAGASLGAGRFSEVTLRRALSVVLLVAVVKMAVRMAM